MDSVSSVVNDPAVGVFFCFFLITWNALKLLFAEGGLGFQLSGN
jgi:hypothetical protein